MKVKGLTKLALSGVALAAVAATLGTSTYAWYVSNSTATVSNIQGNTAASTSGNLLVAQVEVAANEGKITESGAWGNSIANVSAKQTPDLNPVSKDVTGKIPTGESVTATGWHDKDLAPVAKTSAYGYYAFAVYSTDKVKADVKFKIGNTTDDANFKYQTAYSTDGLNKDTTGIGVFDQFTTDFLQAIRIEVFQAPLKIGAEALTLNTIFTDETTTGTGADAVTSLTYRVGVYCPADTFLAADGSAGYTTKTIASKKFVTGGNAHTYYHAVLGEDPAGNTAPESLNTLTNGIKQLDLPKDNKGTADDTTDDEAQKYIVVLRYWLEGGDTDCFDSCGGQTFKLDLDLTAAA
jgi:hypothetical protein